MPKPPNILLITSDQQHWDTLGVHNPAIRTPSLDRLAAEGMDFRRAYCPNPTCTPSRASILTGQYPSLHGAWSLGTKLREDSLSVAAILGKAGYRTGLIGKAHFQPIVETEAYPSVESMPKLRDLAFWHRFHGPFYGFDHVELARHHGDEFLVGGHYATWLEERGADWKPHFRHVWRGRNLEPSVPDLGAREGAWSLPAEWHTDAWVTERSKAFVDESPDHPFFLWASYFDPHPPYLAPEPWASMYAPDSMRVPLMPGDLASLPLFARKALEEPPDFSAFQETPFANHGLHSHRQSDAQKRRNMALYYGMISMLDQAVGELLGCLDARGLGRETLVVFTSDHGHYFGQHGLVAKGPFHYEDGIRVPMLARWTGRIPAGTQCVALQSLVDLAPTFLAAAGLPIPAAMQGVDQSAVWAGGATPARGAALVENRHQPHAVNLLTLVAPRHKLTIHERIEEGELFDLENDPGEDRNLWGRPEVAGLQARLGEELLRARLATEPLSMPRIANA